MTTPGSGERFTLTPSRSRLGGSVGKASWITPISLFVLCAATAIASPAQSFKTLVNFKGTNGEVSVSSLVQGLDGSFYGTTIAGGFLNSHSCSPSTCGTIFKITRSGTLTRLYRFCAQTNCPDGANPLAGLVQGTDGNFYGTTLHGGSSGSGTVFKITPSGVLTTLYNFCAETICADGQFPGAELVQGTDGNFYGTTITGGTYQGGTVFKITPSGTQTTLHTFNGTDGAEPAGVLAQSTDGNFYGTTAGGGREEAGTVFKITPGGTLTTLHTFGGSDGVFPLAGLVQGTDGNFYGTTKLGGDSTCYNGETPRAGCGTIFKITPAGTLTTLHTFGGADGVFPLAELVQGTDGNFYGTTSKGGDLTCGIAGRGLSGCGTIFKITPGGTLTSLHTFGGAGGADGVLPDGGLAQATSGTFYGTTVAGTFFDTTGEHDNLGTVFSLCVGLGWFAETLPNDGKVGDTIDILGTDLTGASSVTFNGIAAPFTVVSPTLIRATVPQGPTTGYVRVTLPSGRIRSNQKFRVTP